MNTRQMRNLRRPGQEKVAVRAELGTASVQGTTATLRLYDFIDSWGGFWGVSAKEFTAALDELPDTVTEIRLHVNSPGGEVYEGLAILNALRQHPATVVAIVDGIAASAASFVIQGADQIFMAPNSELMIHNALGICYGNSGDLRALAALLDKVNRNIADVYARRAGGDIDDWLAAMDAETWYSHAEAVAAGLADAVLDDAQPADPAAVTNRFDLSVFAHAGRADAPDPAMPAQAGARPPQTPAAARGGSIPPKEGSAAVAFTDDQLTTMRQKLGVEATADEATILAALDESLAERADTNTQLPAGVVAIDAAQLDELRAAAQLGQAAHARQATDDRAQLVDAAVADGRIAPARRDNWLNALAADPGAADVLAGLEKGLIPVGPAAGYTGGAEATAEDAIYASLYPEKG